MHSGVRELSMGMKHRSSRKACPTVARLKIRPLGCLLEPGRSKLYRADPSMGTTLAHGDFLPEERQSISQAAEAAGSEVEFVSNAEEARTSLARRVPASVITLEADANSAQVAAIARAGSE